jgi:hypothetical protein
LDSVGFFWAFYRTGIARNFFDSKQFNWVASIASILGVGVLSRVSGSKRQFTIATVVLFTLAALVGKASEPPSFPFKLLSEPRGPKSTRATQSNLGPKCGPNRIVLDSAAYNKVNSYDGIPFLHNWLDYGGTPLFGNNYSTSFGTSSCYPDLKVAIFPESGVMVDKLGLNPSFIPR